VRGKRLTVYLGEADQLHRAPLYLAVLRRLKAEGCAGATVTRGIAGFGPHSQIKTARLVDLSLDLPIVVTVVDRPERIERWAAIASEMLAAGLVTVEDVEVRFHSPAFTAGVPDVEVRDVMSTDPETVSPDAPIRTVVQMLLERDYTVLPVVDAERRVVGVVGDWDLLTRGHIPATIRAHAAAGAEALDAMLRELAASEVRVREVMTTPAVTTRDTARLPEAARLMHQRRLKRLPVVDETGRLVGVLGRIDILAAVAAGAAGRTAPRSVRLPQEHCLVGEIMEREVPVVTEATPLDEVLERLVASPVHDVIVTDTRGQPVGIITETDVLARVEAAERPGLLTLLRSRWNREAARVVRRSSGKRASDVMAAPVVTVAETAPVLEALTVSATRRVKQLAVVDATGRFVGMVTRPALLGASLDLVGRS